jgi:hypothetical protein
MLINHGIQTLIGGVSQQPAIQRHPSQVDAMENMVPSVASGLRKRVGTQHGAFLGTTDWSQAFVHPINRGTPGTSERYFVVADQGNLKVFNWFGQEQIVNFPDGKFILQTFPDGSLARDIFGAVTVADYTFFVNKLIPTAMQGFVPDTPIPSYYVVVKAGVAKTRYFVALGGVSYSYETTDITGFKTEDITTGLRTAINAGGTFTATQYGNLLAIIKNDHADFIASTTDSYADNAMFGFKDTVARYEELPRRFIVGPVIEVKGTNGSNDSYFVTWQQRDGNADGVWVETTKLNIETDIWPDGMPWQLTRNADSTWTFSKVVWDIRKVGDDNSNPVPSFIGSPISDIFFFRNRLGFLAGESIVMSEAGNYFNFFGTTARTDVDSDPIDVSASTTQVTLLRHALPFEKSMLIFSDQHQFQLSSGDILSGRTARLDPTTAYAVSSACRPTLLGKNVLFPTERGSATAIREYYFDASATTSDAADTTAHVPSYVPSGVFRMSTAPTEDMLFVQSTLERNVLWVYNSYWNGEEKVQSAWHKWVFDPADVIVSADVFGTTLAMIVKRADGVFLDWIELEEHPYSPAPYPLCLDRWVGYATGVYSPAQDRTFWTLPYKVPVNAAVRVITCNEAKQAGQGLIASAPWLGNIASIPGNHTNTTVVIGLEYDAWFRLSEQFYRDPQDKPVANARMQMRDLILDFADTGYFEVTVQPTGREAGRYVYSGKRLGLAALQLGVAHIGDGSFKVPLMARSDEVVIECHNRTHLPCVFMSAEWQANVAMQAQRR